MGRRRAVTALCDDDFDVFGDGDDDDDGNDDDDDDDGGDGRRKAGFALAK